MLPVSGVCMRCAATIRLPMFPRLFKLARGSRLAAVAFVAIPTVAVFVCALGVCGCHQFPKLERNAATEMLRTAAVQREAITLEVFHIRVPNRQSETLTQLWREIDEQVVPVGTRQAMARQGFRVGVQGMSLSPTMARFLELHQSRDLAVTDAAAPAGTSVVNALTTQDVSGESLVRMKVVNVFPQHDSSITIEPYSDPLAECPLFWLENGRTVGQTYRDALGRLVVSAKRTPEGGVRLDVAPELRHGESRLTYARTAEQTLAPKVEQPSRTFSELKTSVTLLTGQWLILGMTPSDGTSLGRCFFSRRRGDYEQKIIAIRVVHAGSDR